MTAPDFPRRLRSLLAIRQRVELQAGPVPAAVLLPLFLRGGKYHLLFTKRTAQLQHHGGEISFPGGVLVPEEGAEEGALREAWEETGIRPADVEVLGLLDDVYSIHHYLVTPVVGVIPGDYAYTINRDEIERLIEVPLEHFLTPGVMRREQRAWQGQLFEVVHYDYRGDDIWGMTAGILSQLLEIVFDAKVG